MQGKSEHLLKCIMELQKTTSSLEQSIKYENWNLSKLYESHKEGLSKLEKIIDKVTDGFNRRLNEEVSNLDKRISELEKKPAKRWEGVVSKVIYAVVGAAVAYFIARFGLGI